MNKFIENGKISKAGSIVEILETLATLVVILAIMVICFRAFAGDKDIPVGAVESVKTVEMQLVDFSTEKYKEMDPSSVTFHEDGSVILTIG